MPALVIQPSEPPLRALSSLNAVATASNLSPALSRSSASSDLLCFSHRMWRSCSRVGMEWCAVESSVVGGAGVRRWSGSERLRDELTLQHRHQRDSCKLTLSELATLRPFPPLSSSSPSAVESGSLSGCVSPSDFIREPNEPLGFPLPSFAPPFADPFAGAMRVR